MSQRFRHGLVVGKFYPPHLGHHRLIELAAARCETVTVLAMAARGETVPLADRVDWLRATHAGDPRVTVCGMPCDAPVDIVSATTWKAQETAIRVAVRNHNPLPVDAVFSSESYGDELAARLGAHHVLVDPDRIEVPISATRVRADLAGCWDQLSAPTRAGLATRIVLLGAESTGTTTIAELLAAHYRAKGDSWARTRCVAEFGREFTVTKWQAACAEAVARSLPEPPLDAIEWTAADFDLIGAEQTRREQQAAAAGSPVLVCDTDAFATMIWERRYLAGQARPPQPWATSLPRRDVYLLTDDAGVPWHDDGLREGDLAIRAAMTDWFADALTVAGHSWVLLSGDLDERLALAVTITDRLLADQSHFGPAITEIAPPNAPRSGHTTR